MWWTFLAAAYADTLELDNGAVLVGQLAAYDRGGDCRIAIEEGDLAGAVVVVPCARVARFERQAAAPLAAAVEEVAPAEEVAPVDADEAPVPEPPPVVEVPMALPVEEPLPAAPIARTWLDNLGFSDPFRR